MYIYHNTQEEKTLRNVRVGPCESVANLKQTSLSVLSAFAVKAFSDLRLLTSDLWFFLCELRDSVVKWFLGFKS